VSAPAYNADYFIRKFEAIPEDRWTTGVLHSASDRRCALGHCVDESSSFDGPVYAALLNLSWRACETSRLPTIISVNDGYSVRYQQPTPRARVLAWLRDAKEAGL